ncbi:MAG: 2,3-bisphosphoglycerate-independent phosphoglycerate mutase [Nitrospirae bacterium]|nr:2,3-bisphosphoglycerate-independent phosphoglycerate mutase [Nitrospirota bacterium]
MDPNFRPVTLIIIDGWGLGDDPEYSARAKSNIPFYDSLVAKYPNASISASGEEVGLPEGQMGNSEVGHLNIGAGRIVYQDYTRINIAIRDGLLVTNVAIVKAMDTARDGKAALHLMGLLSDGGVHSDIRHVYALLKMAAARGLTEVYVHAFLDGRDTPPKSGLGYVKDLAGFIEKEGLADVVRIATVSGRYYAMDRDNRWDRVKKAFDAMVAGEGNTSGSAALAVEEAYARGETDEFVVPTVIGGGAGRIKDGDSVIFFNFRTDRTRELTQAVALDNFDGFPRENRPKLATFVCMTEYNRDFGLPVAFPPHSMDNILGEVISAKGLRQLRIAETEKYAHVTFFFNGGREEPFPGEDRCLVPSPKEVATYDLKPQMSAVEVTDEVVKRIQSGVYDVVIMNFANPDMVGHTGIMDAAVKACETVDACLARIVPAVEAAGGVCVVTSDHGNVEKMFDPGTHSAHTAHTSNRVPFLVAREGLKLRPSGLLADVAPTILDLMGMDKPAEMTGESMIIIRN